MALSPLIESFQSSFLKALHDWVQIISGDFHVFGIFMGYSRVMIIWVVELSSGGYKVVKICA